VVARVLLCDCLGVLGSCQGVACYLFARLLRVVAGVFWVVDRLF